MSFWEDLVNNGTKMRSGTAVMLILLINGTVCLSVLGHKNIQDNSSGLPRSKRSGRLLLELVSPFQKILDQRQCWRSHHQNIQGDSSHVQPGLDDITLQDGVSSLPRYKQSVSLFMQFCSPFRKVLDQHQHQKSQSASSLPQSSYPTKPEKLFSWGKFYATVKTLKLNLLVAGKMVNHSNGTFSVYFHHNATGEGNVSVSLVPPMKTVEFDLRHQNVVYSKDSKIFTCRADAEKSEQSRRTWSCNYDPSKSCYHEQTQTYASWICSGLLKVVCVYISFYSTDYRLVQKVCLDYSYNSALPYLPTG